MTLPLPYSPPPKPWYRWSWNRSASTFACRPWSYVFAGVLTCGASLTRVFVYHPAELVDPPDSWAVAFDDEEHGPGADAADPDVQAARRCETDIGAAVGASLTSDTYSAH